MSFRIYLSPPDVGALEEEFVLDALRSGWVAPLGPHVDAFEREIADFVGVDHAVALSSGTAGLHLGLLALGVGPGDEVVVPTLTFGATPVFIDSEPVSFNLDPDLLAEFLASRAAAGRLPAAVIVVDIFGQTADYDRILPLCEHYGVPVLEDAAEALGATHRLGHAGSFGRAAVFSFNGNKIMTTSGGGMLVTQDEEFAARIRHLATQAREPVPWYEHRDIGFNYRMSNVLAALGRAQFRRLPEMIVARRAHVDTYTAMLGPLGVDVLQDPTWSRGNGWLSIARPPKGTVSSLIDHLAHSAVEARHVWRPLHTQPVFSNSLRLVSGVAEGFFDTHLCLPSGSKSASSEIEGVALEIAAHLEFIA
jgi:dTDP-4-amino-4,6-dideoxygalactose transaminase